MSSTSAISRAHPRSRGENHCNKRITILIHGSSPLTRGKLSASVLDDLVAGLIPAHAGKTFVLMRGPPGSWAHPRSRGENSIVVGAARAAAGSSPLTRGKQGQQARAHPDRRLIPAHAGKTRRAAYATRRSAAHPRSRGENRVLYGSLSEVQGSSPLTRGKRDHSLTQRLIGGLIPAHAGKTA